ncbi:MAG: HD domain-containing protein [Candidatus Eisenbacteria bacterium]|nr:HD domain-containing protein [Candidatus Eisenbacteria bacterium]
MMNLEMRFTDPQLERALRSTAELVRSAGGRALVVGGSVRDMLKGRPACDLDIEVYGIEPERLVELLGERFELDLVGEAFGVIKIKRLPIDVSIPRRESKIGRGHRGFLVDSDPEMSVYEAAQRRDFTINAMALDPLTGEIVDPFDGRGDLKRGILRHTSGRFVEDPLRVLRAMQFAARFDLRVAAETIELCATIEPEGLAPERVFGEWRKLVVEGVRPSRGLRFLRASSWTVYYPELHALIGSEQDPEFHPEGDVWVHTLASMDAFAAERTGNEREDLVVGLAVLCHDFGKPATSEVVDDRIRSFGHEEAGERPTRALLSRMTRERDLIEEVVALVVEHMKVQALYDASASDRAIRRLARRVGRIDRLVRVARADRLGCAKGPRGEFPAGDWLLERAEDLEVRDAAPKPIVRGRHLIEMGYSPGPLFGEILDVCYEAQLDGKISTLAEGRAFALRLLEELLGDPGAEGYGHSV